MKILKKKTTTKKPSDPSWAQPQMSDVDRKHKTVGKLKISIEQPAPPQENQRFPLKKLDV